MSAFVFKSAEVQQIATKIEGLKDEVKQILDIDLTNHMIELTNVWKSNAATNYDKQFQEIKARFVDFYNAIEYMHQSINDVTTALNVTDEANNVG